MLIMGSVKVILFLQELVGFIYIFFYFGYGQQKIVVEEMGYIYCLVLVDFLIVN